MLKLLVCALLHLQGVYGLLSIPYALMLLVGILLDEQRALTDYRQVHITNL